MTIKKGDFIELDYTATLTDTGSVFDTTNPVDAEKAGMICNHDHDSGHGHHHVTKDDFKSIIVCVGESHVLPGLDEQLVGLNIGLHDIILGEENAFGKKDSKLLKLMPLSAFKKQKINPFIGLTVDMDGTRGVIRSVSGGRVIVDFNHPLSGKTVKYSINIKRKVVDAKEKAKSVFDMVRLPVESVIEKDDSLLVKIPFEIPESLLDNLKGNVERLSGKKIVFDIKKKEELKVEKKTELKVEKKTEKVVKQQKDVVGVVVDKKEEKKK